MVSDPVGRISISGVHGRDELVQRIANAPSHHYDRPNPVAALLVGAAVGAVLMYLLKRE